MPRQPLVELIREWISKTPSTLSSVEKTLQDWPRDRKTIYFNGKRLPLASEEITAESIMNHINEALPNTPMQIREYIRDKAHQDGFSHVAETLIVPYQMERKITINDGLQDEENRKKNQRFRRTDLIELADGSILFIEQIQINRYRPLIGVSPGAEVKPKEDGRPIAIGRAISKIRFESDKVVHDLYDLEMIFADPLGEHLFHDNEIKITKRYNASIQQIEDEIKAKTQLMIDEVDEGFMPRVRNEDPVAGKQSGTLFNWKTIGIATLSCALTGALAGTGLGVAGAVFGLVPTFGLSVFAIPVMIAAGFLVGATVGFTGSVIGCIAAGLKNRQAKRPAAAHDQVNRPAVSVPLPRPLSVSYEAAPMSQERASPLLGSQKRRSGHVLVTAGSKGTLFGSPKNGIDKKVEDIKHENTPSRLHL